jgi:hypothetical protein
MPIDCSKYNNDVRSMFLKLVPYFWKITQETGLDKEVWVEYLNVISGSLEYVQDAIFNDCTELKSFLDVTGQHLSLEEYLNNTYDSSLRRIYIQENQVVASIKETWYLDGELDPEEKFWYLDGELDPVPKTWFLDSDSISIYDFTIYIPLSIASDEEAIRLNINNYVLATKQFNIQTF